MVHFVGAGSGAKDLITVRGKELIEKADVIIYAGSLVNKELLEYRKTESEVFNSAEMTLEEVIGVIKKAESRGKTTVRLHTGDMSIYGAVKEQYDELERLGIEYDVCPGVSSFLAAAASLGIEYTLPGISQSVIITRMEGRTPVPEKEKIETFAAHNATMVIFLSAGMTKELSQRLIEGGYSYDTPCAIVYKATWEDEKKVICTVGTLSQTAEREKINKTALIIVGEIINGAYERSKLYDPSFTTGFRQGNGNG
ncbi:precorrin-4 C(11)-methyltransferase [Anaerotignum faecicola]|nr:precorrin-4 C(11)-methyltransferase [Anaerotignum faecicola]